MNNLIKDIGWYLKRKQRKANSRSDGHSQYGQDVVAMELLGNPESGTFIDIGANDGVTYSNSLLFEQRGWTGVCVEPHPVIFSELQEQRKCHLLNACVAAKDEIVDFLVVDGPGNMLSGIAKFCDERHMAQIERNIEQKGGGKRMIEIEALSPETMLARFDIKAIDYLSIDTEGCEMQILKTFDFDQIPVKLISVENNTRTPAIFRYLATIGFSLVKCVGSDEFYRRRDD